MFAVYAAGINRDDPLSVLGVGDLTAPQTPDDWATVTVRAASLNHHDLWALKGQALREEQVPMILGTDAAGVADDGRDVVVYPVIGDQDARGLGRDGRACDRTHLERLGRDDDRVPIRAGRFDEHRERPELEPQQSRPCW